VSGCIGPGWGSSTRARRRVGRRERIRNDATNGDDVGHATAWGVLGDTASQGSLWTCGVGSMRIPRHHKAPSITQKTVVESSWLGQPGRAGRSSRVTVPSQSPSPGSNVETVAWDDEGRREGDDGVPLERSRYARVVTAAPNGSPWPVLTASAAYPRNASVARARLLRLRSLGVAVASVGWNDSRTQPCGRSPW
jgi:hypothetical protein